MADRVAAGPELESRLLSARSELERRLAAGTLAAAEELRDTFPDVWGHPDAALELAFAEYALRAGRGERPSRDDWYRRFPAWRDRLERLFAIYDLGAGPDDAPEGDARAGYELLGEIGRGGMGVVYKARQIGLNRLVALKMLRGGVLFRPEDAARIRREAEVVARLQHPNIVQVFEAGELDGAPFLSLEYVAGGSLEDALAAARRAGADAVTPEEAARLVETLARAIDHAHRHGIVHRDLKPANVLLAADGSRAFGRDPLGVPKITDFGLAAVASVSGSTTRTDAVVGTPSYMAPEQAAGDAAAIGPPADVYALGGILYRVLAGRPPFEGGTALETLDLVRHTDPVPPSRLRPNLPRDLETVCLNCLRKEPEKRYAGAAELADDLARFLRGEPVRARPVSRFERAVKWARRNPAVAALGVATAALAVAGAALLWVRYEERQAARATEYGLLQSKYDDAEAARQTEHRQRLALERALAGERVARARAHWNGNELDEARRVLNDMPIPLRDDAWLALYHETHAEINVPPRAAATGRFVPSPDGTRVAVFRGNSWEVVLVDAASFEPVARLDVDAYPSDVAFGSDGKSLVVLPKVLTEVEAKPFRARFKRDHSDRVGTWDLTTNRLASESDVGLNATSVLSGNGRFVAGRAAPHIVVRDTATGRVVAELDDPGTPGHFGNLVIDHEGTRLAVLHPLRITIWNVATRQVIDTIHVNTQPHFGRFTPAGDVFLWHTATPGAKAATGEDVVAIGGRDVAAGADLFRVVAPYATRRFVCSPNGRVFACLDNTVIRLHDTRTGRLLATLRGHTSPVIDIGFSPDGRRLYSTAGAIKTWDVGPWAR